ncbi:MAG: ATP-binding cassette domain-containing protein [Halobacteriovoraceae bacterium]|nr:ATP-binding cassette domain-containing protein [Halobacteriovoraceae bacterium]
MKTLLEVDNLAIGYTNILQKQLRFKIKEGDIFLIKGENGTGKTSLVRTILGQQKVLQGKIDWTIDENRRGYLPQLANYDFPLSITLGEILESFSLHQKALSVIDKRTIRRCWRDASGGEKQKVLILTRLQKDVDFLLLDEPFNHMDEKNIEDVTDLLFYFMDKKILKAVLLISHFFPNKMKRRLSGEMELI